MKIEKGKLYYDFVIDAVAKAKEDMECIKSHNKIAVYCLTKDDLDYVKSKGYCLVETYSFHKGCYHIYGDGWCNDNGEWYNKNGYHTITIDQFREFYPEQNKELETGKWYKTEDNSCLFYHRGGNSSYGFQKGVWTENWDTDLWSWRRDGLEVLVATVEYVESALVEEAKRRGLVEGATVKDHYNNTFKNINGTYVYRDNKLAYGGCFIFENGKWAEVIKKDKFAELKEAHKNGAVIQCRAGVDREWKDCSPVFKPVWSNRYEYRIKPDEEIPSFDHESRIDPVDFIVSNKFDFLEGCVIALVSQHKENDGLEDLKAAQHYLQRLIDRY